MPAIRYAVVGLGHIAQVAVLPAFAHARRNSRLAALVSGDRTKRTTLSRKYGVAAFAYHDFEKCLQEVDAVYIALPNSLHAEYTIRAAKAGVHVLCEKPMATTVDECQRMIDACRDGDVRLMIAYRLHFEALTLEVLDLVHRGRIGEPKFFNSSFGMTVTAGNIRTRRDLGGGSLYDIGVYCINAARALFAAEPKEVLAISVNSGDRRLREIDESTGALLRFDGERLASFVTSFNSADVGEFRIVGTRGQVFADPVTNTQRGCNTHSRSTASRRAKAHRDVISSRRNSCISPIASRNGATPNRPARKACRTSASSKPSTSRRRSGRPSRFHRSWILGRGHLHGSASHGRRFGSHDSSKQEAPAETDSPGHLNIA